MTTARWEKGAITQRPTFGTGNSLIDVYDIPVTVLDTNDSFVYSIPVAQFTPERAAASIQERADALLALHGMGNAG